MKTGIKILFGVLLIIGLVSLTLAVTPPKVFGFDKIINLSNGFGYFDRISIGDSSTPLDLNFSLEVIGDTNLLGVLNVSENVNASKFIGFGALTETEYASFLRRQSNVLITGGNITSELFVSTSFNVSAGTAIFANKDYSSNLTSSDMNLTFVEFGPFLNVVIQNPTRGFSRLMLAPNGTLLQFPENDGLSSERFRDFITIGAVGHTVGGGVITNLDNDLKFGTDIDLALGLDDLSRAVGVINLNGNVFTANGANLAIDRSSGQVHQNGINYGLNKKDPNTFKLSTRINNTFIYFFRDATSATNSTFPNNAIIPNLFDDGSGTLQTVLNPQWTIQRIFIFPQVGQLTAVAFGQNTHISKAEAIASIETESFDALAALKGPGSILRGFLVVRGGATDLTNPSDAEFFTAGKFGFGGGAGGGGNGGIASLNDAYLKGNIITFDGTNPVIITSTSSGSFFEVNDLSESFRIGSDNVSITGKDFIVNNDDLFVNVTSGRVGINTLTPLAVLHIEAGANDIFFGEQVCAPGFTGIQIGTSPGTCSNYTLLSDGSDVFINRPTEGNLFFRENNANQMILDSDGNLSVDINTLFVNAITNRVGIGTTNPQQELNVIGDSNVTNNFFVGGNIGINTSNPLENLYVVNGNIGGSFNEGGVARWKLGSTSGSVDLQTLFPTPLRFGTNSITRMTILSTGEVGINTTSPSAKLEIEAGNSSIFFGEEVCTDVQFSGIQIGNTINGCVNYTLISDGSDVILNRPTGGSIFFREGNFNQMVITNTGNVEIGTQLLIASNSGFPYKIARDTITGFLDFQGSQAVFTGYDFISDDNTSLLTIIDNGNVGIGTTSPSTRLDINGIVTATEFNISSGVQYTSDRIIFGPAGGGVDPFFVLGTSAIGVRINDGATSWSAQSDIRTKKNIKTLSVLDKLDDYRAVEFDWKYREGHDVGVIAQELYTLFPEVVSKGSDEGDVKDITSEGIWSVEYSKLAPIALQGVKEVDEKYEKAIQELKSENDLLKDRLIQIEKRLDSMELICQT